MIRRWLKMAGCRLRLKCDGTRAETRFRLSAKWSSPFKSAGASVQLTTGSRGVRISGSNAGYTVFRGSVKGTGHPLHSRVSPSLFLPCAITFQLDSTTVDAHTSAASSRLNWRPQQFKWTCLFRRKTKSGFCAYAITFQLAPTPAHISQMNR